MTSKKFNEPENWKFHTFETQNGSRIRYGFAEPKTQSRGTVVVTGGYGRHIEYYFEKINNWLDRGYTVYAMDWDGQGGSGRENPFDRKKPPTKPFDHHVEIFREFIDDVVKPAPDKPAFLSSHSKGANIILRYLHKYEHTPGFPFRGAILGTPLININTYGLPRRLFKRIINTLDEVGLSHAPLPSLPQLLLDFKKAVFGGKTDELDPEREEIHEGYKNRTEHYEMGFPTVGWLKQAMNSCDEVMDDAFLASIKTPVLILTADPDYLVCVKAQTKAASVLPNGLQKTFENAAHGIWYDHDDVQNELWQDIDSFIKNTGFEKERSTERKHSPFLFVRHGLRRAFGI